MLTPCCRPREAATLHGRPAGGAAGAPGCGAAGASGAASAGHGVDEARRTIRIQMCSADLGEAPQPCTERASGFGVVQESLDALPMRPTKSSPLLQLLVRMPALRCAASDRRKAAPAGAGRRSNVAAGALQHSMCCALSMPASRSRSVPCWAERAFLWCSACPLCRWERWPMRVAAPACAKRRAAAGPGSRPPRC